MPIQVRLPLDLVSEPCHHFLACRLAWTLLLLNRVAAQGLQSYPLPSLDPLLRVNEVLLMQPLLIIAVVFSIVTLRFFCVPVLQRVDWLVLLLKLIINLKCLLDFLILR
jgi:hypothetical protein